jgi:hypothetical protein
VSKKTPKKLVVTFNVAHLSKDEIDELALEVAAQGEESDGQGGKRYDGKTGHPSVPVLGSKILQNAQRQRLVVEFDITGLTKDQIGWLASEAEVQAESSEGHPDVEVTSKVIAHVRSTPAHE